MESFSSCATWDGPTGQEAERRANGRVPTPLVCPLSMQRTCRHAAASVPPHGRCNVCFGFGKPAEQSQTPGCSPSCCRCACPWPRMRMQWVCGGDDNRLRCYSVGGVCGGVVTCLHPRSSISATTTSSAWLACVLAEWPRLPPLHLRLGLERVSNLAVRRVVV